MVSGVLAVVSDTSGTLFVDGVRKAITDVGKVTTLRLIAGQHFVQLWDSNGVKLWEEVVDVPAGKQIVERIELDQRPAPAQNENPQPKKESGASDVTATGSARPSVVPKLEREDELMLLDELVSLPCLADATKCGDVRDVLGSEVSKYCGTFDDQGARIVNAGHCARVLYSRNEQEKALAKANIALDGREELYRGFTELAVRNPSSAIGADARGAASNFVEQNAISMPELYILRAQIRYATSDRSGALTDLGAALNFLSLARKGHEISAHGPDKELADLSRRLLSMPNLPKMRAHLYRAVILAGMERYDEALSDYSEFRKISAGFVQLGAREKKLGEVIQAHLASSGASTASMPELSSTNGGYALLAQPTVTIGPSQQGQLVSLNGEWFCENQTGCDTVAVTVTGSVFSVRITSFASGTCISRDGRCTTNFTGVIDGTAIEGVMSKETSQHDSISNCDITPGNHPFHASIMDGGGRIVINSEEVTYATSWHDAKTWRWQKPQIVCDGLKVDHTSPLMIVLRSKTWNGMPTALPIDSTLPASTGTIASQIDEIVRSGSYATLPQARAIAFGVSQQPSLSIRNQTAYELTVLMAGPVERSLSVPAGASRSVVVPPGTYRVVGQVKASNVLPFFGTQTYATDVSYDESFYIK